MQQIQHCPFSLKPKRYGTDVQSPLPSNDTQKLTDSEIRQVQKIIGSILSFCAGGWYDSVNDIKYNCK